MAQRIPDTRDRQNLHPAAVTGLVQSVKATVLVIDDEEAVGACMQAFLERAGYRVLRAGTGLEALTLMRGADMPIDLALLDVMLPDMTGQALYARLLSVQPKLKVIVCSGYGPEGPVAEIMADGANDFMQKPFSLASLCPKVEALLSQNRNPMA